MVTVRRAERTAAAGRLAPSAADVKRASVKRRGLPVSGAADSSTQILDAARGGSSRRVGNLSNGVPAYKQFAPAGPANPQAPGVSPSGRKARHAGQSSFAVQVNVTPVASQAVRPILSGPRIF